MNIVLWILQILLGLLFIFSGGVKFFITAEMMKATPNAIQFPMPFLYFIGVCEILGGFGLVLPGLLKIKRFLTPLAAIGLLIIMIGAVVATIMGPGVGQAIPPFITGVVCAVIAYGRRDWK